MRPTALRHVRVSHMAASPARAPRRADASLCKSSRLVLLTVFIDPRSQSLVKMIAHRICFLYLQSCHLWRLKVHVRTYKMYYIAS